MKVAVRVGVDVEVLAVKIALTVLLALIIRLQGLPCPAQSPVQLKTLQPAFGVAVRVTGSFK